MDLTKYDIDCSKSKKPVYGRRYKPNGEEYLKKIEEIDIEEEMKEQSLEIRRIKEIYNTQERLKAEELLNDLTDEEYIEELKNMQSSNIDTYEFLNKMEDIKQLYNKMPENVRIKYKNMSKFTKEFLPNFIKEQEERLVNKNNQSQEEIQKETNKQLQQEEMNTKLQQQIEELQKKLGEKQNV